MTKKENKTRKELVERITSGLDEGVLPWSSGIALSKPINLVTGKEYHGINLLALLISGIKKNTTDPRWATFVQIQNSKLTLKQGAKGVPIEVFKQIDKRTKKPVDREAIAKEVAHMTFIEREKFMKENIYTFSSDYYVFNGADIVGLEPYKPPESTKGQRNERIEKLIETSEAKIFYDGNGMNFYNPELDEIHLTERGFFTDINSFYSTALHEMGHSTGYYTRLNRNQEGFKDIEIYAREELVAEICSAMTALELGLAQSDKLLDNHKAYIKSWAKQIRNDPQVLLSAAQQAAIAADYLCFPEKRNELKATASMKETTKVRDCQTKNFNRQLAPNADTKDTKEAQQQSKPIVLNNTNIPEAMRSQARWCAFNSYKDESGKVKKNIFNCNLNYPKGRASKYFKWAKCNDPTTWADYPTALSFAKKHNLNGIAFALDGSGVSCIDLDHHIDDAGKISDFAKTVIDAAGDTYAETSVSGHGIHIFYNGAIPQGFSNRNDNVNLEVYDSARFICVTGNRLDGATSELKAPGTKLSEILKANLYKTPPPYSPPTPLDETDHDLIRRIENSRRGDDFRKLFAGENILGDHSRSDFALCNILAFFSRCNEPQVERIFKQSGLYRETKGEAYVRRTVKKACSTLTKTYNPDYGNYRGACKCK